MKSGKSVGSRRVPLSIISLNDRKVVRSIFSKIAHSSPAHEDLRRKVFRQVANSFKLQKLILKALSKTDHWEAEVLRELAKNPELKRKLVVLANE